jgi:hypothetical protein
MNNCAGYIPKRTIEELEGTQEILIENIQYKQHHKKSLNGKAKKAKFNQHLFSIIILLILTLLLT